MMKLPLKAWAFIRRDFQIESSYQLEFALKALDSLLPLVFFYFLAKLIADDPTGPLEPYGGNYFNFVVIGLAAARYFNLALTTYAASIQRAQMTGCLEAMLSSQTNPETFILLSSLYSLISSSVQLAIIFAAAALFFHFDLSQINVFSASVIFLLSVVAFTSFGVLSSAMIILLKKGDPIGWIFGTMSFILGGAYFPIEVMPKWLIVLAHTIPTTYTLDGLRRAILKGESLSEVKTPALALAAMALFLFPISLKLFTMAVRRAKKEGTLVQY